VRPSTPCFGLANQGSRTLVFFHAKMARGYRGPTRVSLDVARERDEDPSPEELAFPGSWVNQTIEAGQVPI
jgi:hypothetical protein